MRVITRKIAISQNLIRYYTGKPCKNGHIAERFVSSGGCEECITTRTNAWRDKNKETHRARNETYRKRNLALMVAKVQKYRTAKINALPSWVDVSELKKVYQNCPTGFHVDHIVPLRGKNVSGLHVPWNLQYLTPQDNQRKSNKLSCG
jgi:5-methylcytosine-specific restriction endonuclease McrA